MTTLNTAIASAKEAIEKKVCTTAMIPVEDLQVLITEIETRRVFNEILSARFAALQVQHTAITKWKEEGERYFASKSFNPMFRVGQWWADRPWRKRK